MSGSRRPERIVLGQMRLYSVASRCHTRHASFGLKRYALADITEAPTLRSGKKVAAPARRRGCLGPPRGSRGVKSPRGPRRHVGCAAAVERRRCTVVKGGVATRPPVPRAWLRGVVRGLVCSRGPRSTQLRLAVPCSRHGLTIPRRALRALSSVLDMREPPPEPIREQRSVARRGQTGPRLAIRQVSG